MTDETILELVNKYLDGLEFFDDPKEIHDISTETPIGKDFNSMLHRIGQLITAEREWFNNTYGI